MRQNPPAVDAGERGGGLFRSAKTQRNRTTKYGVPARIKPQQRTAAVSSSQPLQEASGAKRVVQAQVCVAGGGPAGMMLGFLLARAGVEVTVLEKHADFLRDFRGDTIHPSTLSILHELGLLQEFLTLPHREVHELRAQVGDTVIPVGDFSHLSTPCRFIALMPQWDFLNFLARQGAGRRTFRLLMRAEATELLRDGERVTGVRVTTPDGQRELRADLVVAADGRASILRQQAGLEVEVFGAPMDVLWFRVPREPSDPAGVLGRFDAGQIFIALDRGDYWQCGYVIAKGSADEINRRGLEAFRDGVTRVAPFPRERANEIRDWDQVKLLTVQVDRLRRWYLPGLLCIGDAAHAMSPIGGVGINLAIQTRSPPPTSSTPRCAKAA